MANAWDHGQWSRPVNPVVLPRLRGKPVHSVIPDIPATRKCRRNI